MRYFEHKELRQRADELKAILLRVLGVKLSPSQESEFERSIEFCMHNAMASVQDHYSVGAGALARMDFDKIAHSALEYFGEDNTPENRRHFLQHLQKTVADALKATSTPPAQNIAPERTETPENGLPASVVTNDKLRTQMLNDRILTKREAFAMAAMQGMLTADADEQHTTARIVSISVNLADALLAELAKDGGK